MITSVINLSIPKFQWCNRWSLEMNKYIRSTHNWTYDYLFMLGLKLIRFSKWGPCCHWKSIFPNSVESLKLYHNHFSFLPFSIGRRVCLGESFSMVSLHLVTALLFQRYCFAPPDGVDLQVKTETGLQGIQEQYKIVDKPRTWSLI